MKKKTATNWKSLEAMSDDDIDTTDIPELGDEFFDHAEQPPFLDEPLTMRQKFCLSLRLWFMWLPALVAFSGACYLLWVGSTLWLTDPILAFVCAAFIAFSFAVIWFCILFGWGD
ncbi:MAG: hypothetical protein ACR2PX_05655 [Endozoicomonas sp.]|uniref:hypothetical protein n=1 Tax=Endozoicomonas sp. TaxID=1892382 RepID=UPI003D9BD577